MEIKYEMHYDKHTISREVYGLSDVLKDVGGMATATLGIMSFIVLLLNWNKDSLDFGIQLLSKNEIRRRCIADKDIDPDDL